MDTRYSLPLNRRLYERYAAEASATLVSGQDIQRPTFLKDLSFRGAGIITDYPLETEEKVGIIVNMPFFFKGDLRLKGRVAWCKEVRAGKIEFKVDKLGGIHTSVGKISFSEENLHNNAAKLIEALQTARPASVKGQFIKSSSMSTTMSPGLKLKI